MCGNTVHDIICVFHITLKPVAVEEVPKTIWKIKTENPFFEGGTKMETEKVYAMPFAKIYPKLVDELAKGKAMEKIKRTNK